MYKFLKKWVYPPSFYCPADTEVKRLASYTVYGRSKASSILEDTNYTLILADLQAKEAELGGSQDEEPWVYDERDSHWGAGWVECIYIRDCAPKELLDFAEEILHGLDGYPVYNDDKYSEACHEAIWEYWDKDKYYILRDYGYDDDEAESIAESGEMPDEIYDELRDSDSFN